MTSSDALLADSVLAAATLVTGLQAGTYFTWATGVMPGLARVDDRTFVEAMQRVNVAIVNPVFVSTFLGAPLLAGAAAVTADGPARPWAIAGTVLAVATVDEVFQHAFVGVGQRPGCRPGGVRASLGAPQRPALAHLGRRARLPVLGSQPLTR